jgi:hypothetical protein
MLVFDCALGYKRLVELQGEAITANEHSAALSMNRLGVDSWGLEKSARFGATR